MPRGADSADSLTAGRSAGPPRRADLAQPFDPAVDAACLAWHGWDKVAAAVDRRTLHRAWTWYLTFGLEQVSFALLNGEPDHVVAQRCAAAAAWLDRTAHLKSLFA
ncbi:hypothetical protein [Microtetraspora sp. NBRC 16547]|uniref:hypothetical protein n=1 Tax=Microtetraspora sp. NBRC 16547 TaxID=3030993 RepID=UPI0024A15136|nr:hypothetical protein [Microtetraspora sp. NBRC 16547]GLX00768.1 hypothetical protein Misp02_48540 [Microtetraspora sp. NBRC 16547]